MAQWTAFEFASCVGDLSGVLVIQNHRQTRELAVFPMPLATFQQVCVDVADVRAICWIVGSIDRISKGARLGALLGIVPM